MTCYEIKSQKFVGSNADRATNPFQRGLLLLSGKVRDDKGEGHAQYRKDERERVTLLAVCLRENIARPYIKQEIGKEARVVRYPDSWYREEQHTSPGRYTDFSLFFQHELPVRIKELTVRA